VLALIENLAQSAPAITAEFGWIANPRLRPAK
jgi:hypothetical protein